MTFEDSGAGIQQDLFFQVVEFLKSLGFPPWFHWKVAVFAPGEDDSGFDVEDIPLIEELFDTKVDHGNKGWRVKFFSEKFWIPKPYKPLTMTELESPLPPLPEPPDEIPEFLLVLPLEYDKDLLITEKFKSSFKAHINEHTGILKL